MILLEDVQYLNSIPCFERRGMIIGGWLRVKRRRVTIDCTDSELSSVVVAVRSGIE